jgi:hypothetical protein
MAATVIAGKVNCGTPVAQPLTTKSFVTEKVTSEEVDPAQVAE